MSKFTTKNIDGQWHVMNGPMSVEKAAGRTEARKRATELNEPKVEAPAEVAADAASPELATMSEVELTLAARDEHRAQAAAKKAGEKLPAAPHLDELNRRHAGGLLNGGAKSAKMKGAGTGGRAVRLDDRALVEQLSELVKSDGVRTAGAAVKRLREIGKGSNQKRVAKAWAAMLASGVELPAALAKAAPAAKATKAAGKAAAIKQVEPRFKAGKGRRKAADKTPSEIGKEAAASKSLGARRAAKKAS